MEVNLGNMAAEKASNTEVQHFGKRMVTDHTKANQELTRIAASKNATLPIAPTMMEQKEIDLLGKLSGTEFDKAYMKLMVHDHKTDVKEFEKAAEKTTDPDLRAFFANTLPVLQDHLRSAESLDATVRHEVARNQ